MLPAPSVLPCRGLVTGFLAHAGPLAVSTFLTFHLQYSLDC